MVRLINIMKKNYKGDITGVLTQKKPGGQYTLHRYNIYSPYGMSWHHPEPAELLYKQLLTGFNGERSDSVTNWQFLGAGHRTYNPQQHYFVSEDLAGDGYRFAANNPIMNIDSDGNMSRSMKKGLRIINYVTTLGFGAIHKRWANILGVTLLGMVSIINAGLTIPLISKDLKAVIAGVAIFAGLDFVSLSAAVCPANKGLNIAGAVTGSIAILATCVVGSVILGKGIFNGIKSIVNAYRAYDLVDNTLTDSVESVAAVTPQNIRTTTTLGQELLEQNANFTIDKYDGVSYLVFQSDQEVNDATEIFKTIRENIDENVIALLMVSRNEDMPINLQSIDDYLDAIKETSLAPGGPIVYTTEEKIIAMQKLFEPFGVFIENRMRNAFYDIMLSEHIVDFIGDNGRHTFVGRYNQNRGRLLMSCYNKRLGIIQQMETYSNSIITAAVDYLERYIIF